MDASMAPPAGGRRRTPTRTASRTAKHRAGFFSGMAVVDDSGDEDGDGDGDEDGDFSLPSNRKRGRPRARAQARTEHREHRGAGEAVFSDAGTSGGGTVAGAVDGEVEEAAEEDGIVAPASGRKRAKTHRHSRKDGADGEGEEGQVSPHAASHVPDDVRQLEGNVEASHEMQIERGMGGGGAEGGGGTSEELMADVNVDDSIPIGATMENDAGEPSSGGTHSMPLTRATHEAGPGQSIPHSMALDTPGTERARWEAQIAEWQSAIDDCSRQLQDGARGGSANNDHQPQSFRVHGTSSDGQDTMPPNLVKPPPHVGDEDRDTLSPLPKAWQLHRFLLRGVRTSSRRHHHHHHSGWADPDSSIPLGSSPWLAHSIHPQGKLSPPPVPGLPPRAMYTPTALAHLASHESTTRPPPTLSEIVKAAHLRPQNAWGGTYLAIARTLLLTKTGRAVPYPIPSGTAPGNPQQTRRPSGDVLDEVCGNTDGMDDEVSVMMDPDAGPNAREWMRLEEARRKYLTLYHGVKKLLEEMTA